MSGFCWMHSPLCHWHSEWLKTRQLHFALWINSDLNLALANILSLAKSAHTTRWTVHHCSGDFSSLNCTICYKLFKVNFLHGSMEVFFVAQWKFSFWLNENFLLSSMEVFFSAQWKFSSHFWIAQSAVGAVSNGNEQMRLITASCSHIEILL